MMVDVIEKNNIEASISNISERINSLHKGFDSGIAPEKGVYATSENNALVSANLGVETNVLNKATAFQTIKNMYNGIDIDGNKVKGLKDISNYKVNKNFKYQNLKQHAGFAAEVISSEKENFNAKAEGTGIKTYRFDDMPAEVRQKYELQTGEKLVKGNDQYRDKIRVDSSGKFETVQTKFVGKNASECYSKLKSTEYKNKYINNDKVDKIEVPKDYYDKIKSSVKEDIDKLNKSLEASVDGEGTTAKAQEMKDLKNLEKKLEKSTVSSKEAMFATEHPKLYSAKMLASSANKAGLKGAKEAAILTFAVSSADNVYKYINDEVSAKEAITNVAKETSISGGIGYATGFVSDLTGSSVPAQVITLGVTSYDEVKDFVDGEIDGAELAHGLGRNTVQVIGGAVGGTIGSVAGPVGSIAGGMAGSYAATQAYDAASEFISDNMDTIVETGGAVIEKVGDTAENISDAISDKMVEAQEEAVELKDSAVEKLSDVKDMAVDLKDNAVEKLSDVKDSAAEKLEDVKDGASEVLDDAKGMAVGLKDGAVKKFGAAKGKVLSKFGK